MNQPEQNNLSDWKDNKSWESFFSQFNGYLKSLAVSYKLPSQDAEDVVQEVFVAMATLFQEKKFDPSKGSIYSWVRTFAKWRMVDMIRRNQRQNKYVTSGDDLLLEMQPDENQDPSVDFEKSYKYKLFRKALKQISPNKDYMIFTDFYFKNLNNEQLIAKYKINCGGVYLAKHRTIQKIKKEIKNILCENPNY